MSVSPLLDHQREIDSPDLDVARGKSWGRYVPPEEQDKSNDLLKGAIMVYLIAAAAGYTIGTCVALALR